MLSSYLHLIINPLKVINRKNEPGEIKMELKADWISAIASSFAALASAAAAGFTWWTANETRKTAKESKRMADQVTRPFLVIS